MGGWVGGSFIYLAQRAALIDGLGKRLTHRGHCPGKEETSDGATVRNIMRDTDAHRIAGGGGGGGGGEGGEGDVVAGVVGGFGVALEAAGEEAGEAAVCGWVGGWVGGRCMHALE